MTPIDSTKSEVKGEAVNVKGSSSKKKKLKIAAVVIAAVLVLGGFTAALVVRGIYNRPENVLAVALGDYLLDGEDKNFDSTISLNLEEAIMGVKSIDINAGVQMSGKTTQIDLVVNASIITLKGAVQSNENGNLYVKLEDLPSLLASGSLQSYGLSEDMGAQIASLDGKWIEIKSSDLAALTGKEAGSSEFDKCTTALYAALDNDSLADSVDTLYKKNKFLLAKTATNERVGDKNLLKMEVGLDEAKLKSFADEMGKSADVKALIEACGLASSDTTEAEATAEDSLKNGKLTVWVDRGKKELVKLEASGDSYDADGKKAMEMKMTMSVKEAAAKLEAPTDTVNILTLMQGFGIDPSMLSGTAQ